MQIEITNPKQNKQNKQKQKHLWVVMTNEGG